MKSTVIECFDCKGAMELPPGEPSAVLCPHCDATITGIRVQTMTPRPSQFPAFTLHPGDKAFRSLPRRSYSKLVQAIVKVVSVGLSATLTVATVISQFGEIWPGFRPTRSSSVLETTHAVESVETRLYQGVEETLATVESKSVSEWQGSYDGEATEQTLDIQGIPDGIRRAAANRYNFSPMLMAYAMGEAQGIPGTREQFANVLFLTTHPDDQLAQRVREDVRENRTDDLLGLLALYTAGAEFWSSYADIETAEMNKYPLSPAARARFERTLADFRAATSRLWGDKAKLIVEVAIAESLNREAEKHSNAVANKREQPVE